ncbi:hypothetical protein HG536_0E03270 [Torulaspora globosa]|uniref:HDA1 complex subunit 2 n=1 Tax=Torulaspora globosa TaxID=48254 RepID=A0A7G3ZIT0_9SACH|nr:uncharacterized protein HG536_0E03270 [Torulaspora globosa]QLL33416.1 hypothetical protein HG536_0E03270 [Torulaspora globosa]
MLPSQLVRPVFFTIGILKFLCSVSLLDEVSVDQILYSSRNRRKLSAMSTDGLRQSNVSYLLVDLTSFQKDLVEILISLHASSLKQEIEAADDKINNGDEKMYPQLSAKQMMYIFDSNFRAVANHPCLLVDHYMPRQFLRMEPNENLVNNSDKFRKLQQILCGIIERDRVEFPQVLRICLISHSVRELDLLEGLILGQRVRIKRLSGTSLYDEKHIYVRDDSEGGDACESKDGTPCNDSGANKYTGYSRDDYDYSVKRQKRASTCDDDWLFLTTTAHLINDPSLMEDYDADCIISFDPLLDPSLPALEVLYRRASKQPPIIKFLVADSPDHYILENCTQGGCTPYSELKNSIDHYLRTRHKSRGELCNLDYKEVVKSLLKGEQLTEMLPDVRLSPVATDVDPYQPRMTELNSPGSQLRIDEAVFDMKSYQSELMKRAVGRLRAIQEDCKHNREKLLNRRLEETARQNSLDAIKATIATTFKRFQECEKTANDSEKRLERSQTESDKLEQRVQSLRKTQTELAKLVSLEDSSDIDKALLLYTEKSNIMQAELEALQQTNEDKSKRNNELRSEYQQKSSLAAELAQNLSALRDSDQMLKKEVAGPAPRLNSDALKRRENRLKAELEEHRRRSKFLKAFISKLTSSYDLKLNGDGRSQNSSSSSLNGRASGHGTRSRLTRSNTPTYI